jgi:hypothetical protein
MGFNATVVIGLDQLYWIETDPNFGKSLSLSVMQSPCCERWKRDSVSVMGLSRMLSIGIYKL